MSKITKKKLIKIIKKLIVKDSYDIDIIDPKELLKKIKRYG